MDFKFEWDEVKNAANLEKHGIDFKEVADNLGAKPYLVRQSKNSGNDDLRFQAIIKIGDRYHTIIYTLRHNKIRIISARRAREDERKEYDRIY